MSESAEALSPSIAPVPEEEEGWSTVTGKSSSNNAASSANTGDSSAAASPLKQARRLKPQFSISKQNLGPSSDTPSTTVPEKEKEKVGSRETVYRDRDRDRDNTTSSYRERDRFGNSDRFHNSPRSTFGSNSSPRSAENAVDNSASAALSAAMGINLSKNQTAEKRKVVRFTREELIEIRAKQSSSKVLSVMSGMLEVLSLERQEPACLEKFDQDDVIRIINSHLPKDGNAAASQVGGAMGRGRGRGRGLRTDDGNGFDGDEPAGKSGGGGGDWTRGAAIARDEMWDATGAGGATGAGFDMADFAAAAAKFREDMEKMNFHDERGGVEEEDTMEQLHRLQQQTPKTPKDDLDALLDDELGGLVEDDDLPLGEVGADDDEDDIPDWADDDDAAEILMKRKEAAPEKAEVPVAAAPAPLSAPEAKRNLLLESLKVKSQPAPAVAAEVVAEPQRPPVPAPEFSPAAEVASPPPVPEAVAPAPPVPTASAPVPASIADEFMFSLQLPPIPDPRTLMAPPTREKDFDVLQGNFFAHPALAPAFFHDPPLVQRGAAKPMPLETFAIAQEWLYTDPQGHVQGPFTAENMRAWHEAGYFAKDLPIKLRTWSTFHPFFNVFFDSKAAFFGPPPIEPGRFHVMPSFPSSLEQARRAQEFPQPQPIRLGISPEEQRRHQMALEQHKIMQVERQQAERLQLERQQAERLQLERQQAERLQAERQQAERLQAERLQAERLQAERQQSERQQLERQQQQALLLEQQKIAAQRQSISQPAHLPQQQQHHAVYPAQSQQLSQAPQSAEQLRSQHLSINAEAAPQQLRHGVLQQQVPAQARNLQTFSSPQIPSSDDLVQTGYQESAATPLQPLQPQLSKLAKSQPQPQHPQAASQQQPAQNPQQKPSQPQQKLQHASKSSAPEKDSSSRAGSAPQADEGGASRSKAAAQKSSASPPEVAATSGPAWGKVDAAKSQESLLAIQKAEKEKSMLEKLKREHELKQQAEANKGMNLTWAAAPNSAAASQSLADIQQEEAQRKREKGADPPKDGGIMSNQLKSLLGVKNPSNSSNRQQAASAQSFKWAAGSQEASASEVSAGNSLSLRDIMEQEVTGKQQTVAQDSGGRSKGLSWAAKASSTGSAGPVNYGSASVPASAPAPTTSPRSGPPAIAAAAPLSAVAPDLPSATSAKVKVPPPPQQQQSQAKQKNSFGGKEMSADMAEWCTVQLRRINGSNDITLMQFCMSLNSPVDIREYLSQYLGSSVQVTNFATDFIKYKEGGRRALLMSSGPDLAAPAGPTPAPAASAPQPGGGPQRKSQQPSNSGSSNTNTTSNSNSGFINAGKKKKQQQPGGK